MSASISAPELQSAIHSAEPPLIIDVRRLPAFKAATELIAGALRRDPEAVSAWAKALPAASTVVPWLQTEWSASGALPCSPIHSPGLPPARVTMVGKVRPPGSVGAVSAGAGAALAGAALAGAALALAALAGGGLTRRGASGVAWFVALDGDRPHATARARTRTVEGAGHAGRNPKDCIQAETLSGRTRGPANGRGETDSRAKPAPAEGGRNGGRPPRGGRARASGPPRPARLRARARLERRGVPAGRRGW